MAIAVQCSGCKFGFQVKDKWSGRKVKCRRCGGPVSVAGERWPDEEYAGGPATGVSLTELQETEASPQASRSGSAAGKGSSGTSRTGTQAPADLPANPDLAAIDSAGGLMKPLPSVALTAAEQLTFEYRDPWDLAHAATEMRARLAPRMCRRWKYPGEPMIEAHLWKALVLLSLLLVGGGLWRVYSATQQPAILSVQLIVGVCGFAALMPLMVRTNRACAQLLKYDGGKGLSFKSTVCFLFAGACAASILAQYDQSGFYGAIGVSIIVSGITMLIMMRLEPLEALLTTAVCTLTFSGGLAIISHIAVVIGLASQAFIIDYIPPTTQPGA